jgi:outer membrane immunogenic protein
LAGRCINITLENHLCRYAKRGSAYLRLFARMQCVLQIPRTHRGLIMHRFRFTTLAAVAVFGFVSVASAADLPRKAPAYAPPPAPVFSWAGFYIGADIGGVWASQDVSDVPCASCSTDPASGTLKGSSFIGGVYAGYNFMIAPTWLLGIEADWSGTHLADSTTAPQTTGGVVDSLPQINAWQRNLKWLASVRGRVGVTPTPTMLLYMTGGAALGDVSYSAQDIFSGGCSNCGLTSFSQTRGGYVVGAGGEWAPWANNWLLRVEYLYYRLSGTSSNGIYQANPSVYCCTFNWGALSINEVRGGVAFKF